MTVKMDITSLAAFLKREFPQVSDDFAVEHSDGETLIVRLRVAERHLRPGNTVSGPSMFALADVALYLAILARLGPVALAVTTNCSIDFLRKPLADRDLLAEARILKLGRNLVVGDVLLRSDGSDAVVARAGLTYALPPAR